MNPVILSALRTPFLPVACALALAGPAVGADDELALGVRTTDPQSPDAQRAAFRLPPGFEIQLVATEPDIHKPMNLAFDAVGRLWATTSVEYPFPAKDGAGRDRLMVFSDFGPDGRARSVTEFAGGLNIPIGVYPFRRADGHWRAVVWSIPHIWLLEDLDDDGRAERKTPLYGPFDHTRDTHGNQASFRRGFDGWLYATHGFNNDSHVGAPDGSRVDLNSGNTYRIRLDGSRIEHHTHGQVNPFGLAWDARGNLYSSDCHSAPVYQLLSGGWYPSFGKPHDGLGFAPAMIEHAHGSTAIDGAFYYEDNLWPDEYRDTFLIGNVMTSRLNRDRIEFTGSTPRAVEQPDFLTSTDPWFRPVDNLLGPDGALYIADFYNRIIGHYEVPLTHPGRDRERGRIWRVVHVGTDGAPRLRNPALAGDLAGLVTELGSPNLTRRLAAMAEIEDRFGRSALEPVRTAARNPSGDLQRVHALWMLQRLGALEPGELLDAARNPSPLVRVHARRIAADTLQRASLPGDHPPDSIDAARAVGRAGLDDADALVRRCAAEVLGLRPDLTAVRPLLKALADADPADTHLVYVLRKALRDHLAHAPTLGAVLEDGGWSDAEGSALADVALAVPSPGAANLLVGRLDRLSASTRPTLPDALRHIARHAPESGLPRLADFVQERFHGQADFQLALYQAVEQSLQQRGGTPPEAIRAWGSRLALGLLADTPTSPWSTRSLAAAPTPPPWDFEERRTADGRVLRVLSSLPGGEQRTGVLRSPDFPAGHRVAFWLCGHDGYPDRPAGGRNHVRLRRADDHAILFTAAPPRNDTARRIEWDTTGLREARVYLEVTDADTGDAYAWLAVGGVEGMPALPDVSPRTLAGRTAAAADLATRLGVGDALPRLRELLSAPGGDPEIRAAAARGLLGIRRGTAIGPVARVLADPSTPDALREQVGVALSEQDDPAARRAVVAALRTVPFRVQQRWALALTTSRDGADAFLGAVESGAASPRLLQLPGARDRLRAAAPPDWESRLGRLTRDLPPASEERDRLLADRTAGFFTARPDPAVGREIYRQNCAPCHQLDGEGALVGPQLTGIGNRGVERLCEDILDPNRNVDTAFRQSLLTLDDGEILSGLFRREEGEVVVLANAAGQEFSVPRSRVRSRVEIEQSLMPDNFGESLPAEDFHHLLAYLLGQR